MMVLPCFHYMTADVWCVFGEGSDNAAMESYVPAYGIDATTDVGGPQCQCHPDFCFLCSFEPEPSAQGTDDDLYQTIVDLVTELASQDKELPLIVTVVHAAYLKNVQPHLTWESPQTGVVVKSPKWVRESIRRHLIHSNQFNFFPSIVRSIFHSIIVKQNETMIDRSTQMVVEEHRKAFIDTIDAFRKFESFVGTQRHTKTV